jgi:hypothetical protein
MGEGAAVRAACTDPGLTAVCVSRIGCKGSRQLVSRLSMIRV